MINYRTVWNPETQFFHPRNANGEFVEDFKPIMLTYVGGEKKHTNDYVKGSVMQWRWTPFFDTPGLVGLFKNRDFLSVNWITFFNESDPVIGH
ncbi:MAG: putative alpha-1,2-mannosidase [Saprospiraceae bacterium]